MAVGTGPITGDEFDRLIQRSDLQDGFYELIAGEVVEVVTNNYSSLIGANLLFQIKLYLRDHKIDGYVTGEAGGYMVAGERYIPDVGFISKARQPEPSHATYNPNPPDLAVEVLSPTDKPNDIRVKVINYLSAGTVVWLVNPETKTLEVCIPGQPVTRLTLNDTLTGGDVLPGFRVPLADLFPD